MRKMTRLVLLGMLAAGAAANADAAASHRDSHQSQVSYERGHRSGSQVDAMITRAYREILHREPDPRGIANYRREILRNGLTERGMRQALLNSDEYRMRGRASGRYHGR